MTDEELMTIQAGEPLERGWPLVIRDGLAFRAGANDTPAAVAADDCSTGARVCAPIGKEK